VLFGNIAIALIVLIPGISVGEALSRAARGFPKAIAVLLLLVAGFILAALAIVIVATLGSMAVGSNPQSPAFASRIAMLVIIPMIVLVVRMLLMSPVIAMEQGGAVEAIRRSWALGKGNILRFAAVWVLAMFLGILIGLIERFVIGSVVGLLKLGVGQAELLDIVQLVINAAIESILSLGMAVYLALAYRKLAEG